MKYRIMCICDIGVYNIYILYGKRLCYIIYRLNIGVVYNIYTRYKYSIKYPHNYWCIMSLRSLKVKLINKGVALG